MFRAISLAIGITVGLIIALILVKVGNSDSKIKTQYDERQERIRGMAYRYSFYTVIILEAILVCLKVGEIEFPFADYLVHTFVLLAGCLVLCVYSIWNGVYWGMNNNHRRYYIMFAIATICNILPIVAAVSDGSLKANGPESLPMTNVMVVIWLAIIGCSAIIRKLVKSDNNEED